jgi:ABC-type nitrate/sulfonate/bicarbonate transport system permease component
LLIGGRDADTGALEIVRAHGGSAVHQLLKVRLFYALPYLFTGLRMAAPAAVLGAVVAEYLGGDKGIGVAMVYSQQSLDVTRTWALALYTALLAGLVYALLSLIERWATPWAREAPSTTLPSAGQEGGPVRRALTGAGYAVLSVGLVLALWQTGIMASGLDPYFAKTPADVWSYLVTEAGAAANRSELLSAMGTTLEHTAVGLVIGIAAALLVAALVTVYAPAATLFMPVAVTLRTVPMVAMTPLIALVFGRGLLTVAVIAGLVTFFPVFVAVVDAMRGAPASACDVVAVYGAGPLAQFRRVRLPYALPAFLGATRVAAPTALLGALLAEWLATGDGIGTLMLRAGTVAAYDRLWASVALVTAVSFILYGIASLCESLSLRFLRGH